MSYLGGVHPVKNGCLDGVDHLPQVGVEDPSKEFPHCPEFRSCICGTFLSRMGNSMGEMSGEATKYEGRAAGQPDVKRARACVSSRSAVGFVMISTAPSSRARWVSLVSA